MRELPIMKSKGPWKKGKKGEKGKKESHESRYPNGIPTDVPTPSNNYLRQEENVNKKPVSEPDVMLALVDLLEISTGDAWKMLGANRSTLDHALALNKNASATASLINQASKNRGK